MIRIYWKSLGKPLFTLALITILVLSPLLFVNSQKVSAAGPTKDMSPPLSAPPEPFLIHSTDNGILLSLASIADTTSSFAAKTKELIKGPAIPDGLGAAHAPTLTERVTNAFASAMPKIALSAAPPPPPPSPTPAGAVNFDFDGDGKADYGRWHSGTTEFKVKNSSGSGGTYACTSGTYNTCSIGSSSAKAAPGDYS